MPLDLGLSLALAALLVFLLREEAPPRPKALVWLGGALLFTLAARNAGWLHARLIVGPDELPPRLPLSGTWAQWRFELFAGALGFVCLRPTPKGAWLGALCAALFCAFGYAAARWLIIAQAWKLIGGFSGALAFATLPFLLWASCAAAAFALLSEDARASARWVVGVLLAAWYASAMWFQSRLETNWDFGPRTLAVAANLERRPASVAVALLKPDGREPYRVEQRPAVVDGVDASQQNLVRLYEYLEKRQYRSLFLKQGLRLLRRGWLLWWDCDRALKAAALAYPGRVVPDYRGALDLLKAGPQTQTRLEVLRTLAERAKLRKEGFEDVTQSQYIFEGFSGAYARFGDEADARTWLLYIDNLWPIYEKKIEVTPVESAHDGEVDGSVFMSSMPAQGLLVGLFWIGSSTAPEAALSTGTLADSAELGADGRFRFMNLGPGRYYLGLMGAPEDLRAGIYGSPGVFELTPEAPVARLSPVVIEGAPLPGLPAPPAPAAPPPDRPLGRPAPGVP